MNIILSLLEAAPDEAPALSAPGRAALTFGALRALAARTVADLNRIGVGRGDRVAIVLPNGPEMAAGFIAIASACASAPLNPAYRADEFEFYLNDLGARALVVERGSAGRPPYDVGEWFRQMVRVGVDSIPVVFLTTMFTGMVLTLQSAASLDARSRCSARERRFAGICSLDQ